MFFKNTAKQKSKNNFIFINLEMILENYYII